MPNGQISHPGIGIDFDLQLVCQGADPLRRPFYIQHRAAGQAKDHVFHHIVGVYQHKVLVHHADPIGDGVLGVANVQGLAVQLDAALEAVVHPIQHVHQRAFSRAVFAQQGMDLSPFHVQVHMVVGHHAAKYFRDVAHL